MKTQDGYTLKDGEDCFVMIQDPTGEHKLSANLRRATYRSENAIDMEWDFEVHDLNVEGTMEVIGVWKYK
jgi:hypothetical protein